MTAIVRRLCDGEELVTDSQEASPLLEGDPREVSFSRRKQAMSDDAARVRPGHDPRSIPPQEVVR